MKDRIRTIMESQHMTQQVFADYLNVAPATISSIFNGRTKPTVAIIEAIKAKVPSLSTDWLMFGIGPMYATAGQQPQASAEAASPAEHEAEPMLDFGETASNPSSPVAPRVPSSAAVAPAEPPKTVIKYVDKPQRQITEIRIFYDDQTWETFVPKR